VADRKAVVLLVSNSAASNALAIANEITRASGTESNSYEALYSETNARSSKDALLDAAHAKKVSDRKDAIL